MGGSVNNPSGPKKQSALHWVATENQAGAQTDTVLQAAPAVGFSLYITDIIISNGATAGTVELVEKTASSTTIMEKKYFAINGGLTHRFRTPIKVTAAENLGYTSVSVTTHSITVCGFTAPT